MKIIKALALSATLIAGPVIAGQYTSGFVSNMRLEVATVLKANGIQRVGEVSSNSNNIEISGNTFKQGESSGNHLLGEVSGNSLVNESSGNFAEAIGTFGEASGNKGYANISAYGITGADYVEIEAVIDAGETAYFTDMSENEYEILEKVRPGLWRGENDDSIVLLQVLD